MIGLVGIIKARLDMEGKLPDKWKDQPQEPVVPEPIILEMPAAVVSEEGVLSSTEPMTVTDDGVLVIGDILV